MLGLAQDAQANTNYLSFANSKLLLFPVVDRQDIETENNFLVFSPFGSTFGVWSLTLTFPSSVIPKWTKDLTPCPSPLFPRKFWISETLVASVAPRRQRDNTIIVDHQLGCCFILQIQPRCILLFHFVQRFLQISISCKLRWATNKDIHNRYA